MRRKLISGVDGGARCAQPPIHGLTVITKWRGMLVGLACFHLEE